MWRPVEEDGLATGPMMLLAFVLFWATGCGQQSDHNISEESIETSAPPSEAEEPSVTLTPGTWEDVQELVAQSQGRVVVVDLWSTSCAPCIAELPHLGQLQREHANDVVCISVSLDYLGMSARPPEFYREQVQEVLDRCQATCRNYLCTTEADSVFQKLKLSSIPAVYVYNRAGELAQRFDASMLDEESEDEEPFTYERNILPLVHELRTTE